MKTIDIKNFSTVTLCMLCILGAGCSSIVITRPGVPGSSKDAEENGVYYYLPRGTVKVVGTWDSNSGLWDLTATPLMGGDQDAGRFYTERNSDFCFDDDLTIAIDPATGLLTTANGTTTDQSINGIATLGAAAVSAYSLPASFAGSAAKSAAATPPATTAASTLEKLNVANLNSLFESQTIEKSFRVFERQTPSLKDNLRNTTNEIEKVRTMELDTIAIQSRLVKAAKMWFGGQDLSSNELVSFEADLAAFPTQLNELSKEMGDLQSSYNLLKPQLDRLSSTDLQSFITKGYNLCKTSFDKIKNRSGYFTITLPADILSRMRQSFNLAQMETSWSENGRVTSAQLAQWDSMICQLIADDHYPYVPLERTHFLRFLAMTQDAWRADASPNPYGEGSIADYLSSAEWTDVWTNAFYTSYESLMDPFDPDQADSAGVLCHSAYVVSTATPSSAKPTYARFDMILKPLTPPAFNSKSFPGGPLFVDSDIIGLTNLVFALRNNRDALSIHLYKMLIQRPGVPALLDEYKNSSDSRDLLRANILAVLNDEISGESIYRQLPELQDDKYFNMRHRTKELLDADPHSGPNLRWLNRWLIGDALTEGDGLARPQSNGILVRDPIIYTLTIYCHLWASDHTQYTTNSWTYTYVNPTSLDTNFISRRYVALYQGVVLPDVNHTHVLSLQRDVFRQTSTKISLSEGMVLSREDTHQSLFNALASIPKDVLGGIVGGGGSGGGGGNSGGGGSSSGGGGGAGSGGGGSGSGGGGSGSGGGAGATPPTQSPPIQ